MSQQFIIMVSGPIGSGKTTAAHYLQGELGCELIMSDKERKSFVANPTYSREENELVIKHTRELTRALLEEGKSVIVDATFTKRSSRKYFAEVAEKLGIPFFVLYFVTEDKHAKQRIESRQLSEKNRSTGTYEARMRLKKEWEEHELGIITIIDNNGSIGDLHTQLDKVVDQITNS